VEFTIGLVIGLIIGWLLNWVIQPLLGWLGRRPSTEISGLNETLADLAVRLNALESASLGDTPRILTVTEESTVAQVFVKDKDPLEDIVGIGPVFASRFNDAGIYTFEELAKIAPNRAREIAAAENWHKIEPEAWIQQAVKLAKNAPGRSNRDSK